MGERPEAAASRGVQKHEGHPVGYLLRMRLDPSDTQLLNEIAKREGVSVIDAVRRSVRAYGALLPSSSSANWSDFIVDVLSRHDEKSLSGATSPAWLWRQSRLRNIGGEPQIQERPENVEWLRELLRRRVPKGDLDTRQYGDPITKAVEATTPASATRDPER